MQDRLLEKLLCADDDVAQALRVLLVYAHPDDEAIAVGGRLQRFANALFVQVTDGAPADNVDGARLGLTREQYRVVRERESCAAFRAGRVPHPRRRCLEITDKETALHLAELTERVERLIVEEQAEAVFTHPYEGGHADHDACAFAVHAAVERLRADDKDAPVVAESPFYHGANGTYQVGRFLPHSHAGKDLICTLTVEERKLKKAVLSAFQTQADVLRDFDRPEERFRVAPPYDFTRPPHAGKAYYERFIDGMTPGRFCSLADDVPRTRHGMLACH